MSDLCQLDDVKGWLKIPLTQTSEDDGLTRLITAVSAEFLNEIDRNDFTPNADYTNEVHRIGPHHFRTSASIYGGSRSARPREVVIPLRHWPINSIASVTLDGATVSASSDGSADGYYYDATEDPEYRNTLKLINISVVLGRSVVLVNYNAGYSAVPKDAEQAVIEWVAYKYRSKDWIGQTSKSLNTGENAQVMTVRYPDSVAGVVKRYSRPVSIL
jgi:hypothetical protein